MEFNPLQDRDNPDSVHDNSLSEKLLRLIIGYSVSQSISVVAELGIAGNRHGGVLVDETLDICMPRGAIGLS